MSNRRFQRAGRSWSEIESALREGRDGDLAWTDPRNLKASYFAGEDVVRVAGEAFNLYMGDNAIYGGSLYPSLPRLEAEVVAKVLEMLNAPEGAGGSVTIGGTESIMMAVKSARNWARVAKPRAHLPEIVVPETAHPAFDKAAHLLGLRVVRMQSSPDYRADVAAMAGSVGESTVMIVGSAPPYPYGVVDPIEAIADIALEHDLWMHVDACVGGFLLPFLEELGQPLPTFDFRVAGVRSMSADLHKYGYANRGSSCLLLRDQALEEHQRFTNGDWPAGVYSTLNFAGSRAGGPVASAWAVLNYLGYEGYLERASAILQARRAFIEAIDGIVDLAVLGEPQGGHFAFGASDGLDIAALADGMEQKGWHFARLKRPPAIMLLLNYRHGAIKERFMEDLSEVIERVRHGSLVSRGREAVYIT